MQRIRSLLHPNCFPNVHFVISLFLLFLSSQLLAQTKFSISGYIREKESRELLPGVNIYIPSLKAGVITNNYGYYSISLPEDHYEIHFSYSGYEPVVQSIKLSSNQIVNIDLIGITLSEVVISGRKSERISESNRISMVTLPVKQVKQIPSLFGEKDVFKALQLMPGVQKGSEGNSGLYVRGGGPDQNLIILDDAPVYNASHLFGFFSIFNGDALKSVELTKGGFPARYGGRLSSVVEMTMKDGNKQKFSGEAGIGIIASRLLLEGPIMKDVSSFMISGRRTYVDVITRPFMDKSERGGYYFYDLNAKVNYDFGPKNKLYLSGYFGRDKFNIITSYNKNEEDEGGLYWQNATSTFRWNHLIGSRVFSNTSFMFSRYNLKIYNFTKEDNQSYSLEYLSGIRDLGIKYDLEFNASPYYHLRTGINIINHQFAPSAIVEKDEANLLYNSKKTIYESFDGGIYLENNFKYGDKLNVNAGVRLSYFIADNKQYFSPEPRFVINYKLHNTISVKAAYAEMNQYIHMLSNTGIGLPTDLWVPSTNKVKPQHSHQISAGLAKDITPYDLVITIEGYYKTNDKILGYKPGASFMVLDEPTEAQNFTWQDNVTSGSGKSYGIEMLIHRKAGKLNGWVGYTLSWTKLKFDELNFGEEFWARYDRRHDISVVGIYSISPKINFSATWVYGTGNAISLPLAEYPANPHQPWSNLLEMTSGPYINSYTNEVTDYGELNSFRMKPYHRFDLAFQFSKKKEKYERTWEIGMYNVYNRKNPYFYYAESDWEGQTTTDKLKQVAIFPIIPSVTYSIKF